MPSYWYPVTGLPSSLKAADPTPVIARRLGRVFDNPQPLIPETRAKPRPVLVLLNASGCIIEFASLTRM